MEGVQYDVEKKNKHKITKGEKTDDFLNTSDPVMFPFRFNVETVLQFRELRKLAWFFSWCCCVCSEGQSKD